MKPISGLGILAACVLAVSAMADHDDELNDRVSTALYSYDVFYTNDNPYDCTLPEPPDGSDRNYFPTAQARNMAFALEAPALSVPGIPNGYHEGFINLGFRAPDFNGQDDELLVFDCAPGGAHDSSDCDNGQATLTRINMPATGYCSSAEIDIRRVTGHELFHHVQFASEASYGAWGKLLFEGTARMMEDQVYTDIDDSSNTAFTREIARFLDEPNTEFWRASYRGALAWKHLAEQYGTTPTEPQLGVDFIKTLWDLVEDDRDNPDVPGIITSTIQTFSPDTSLKEWYQDFTIANIAKEFDTSGLPDGDKYRYIDEDAPDVTYSAVKRAWTGSAQGESGVVFAVARWGSSYFEADIPTACAPGYVFGFRAGDVDDVRFGALLISETDKVERITRGGGNDFSVAYIQRPSLVGSPYEKLVVAATGGDEQDAFNFVFDCAPGNMEILRPNDTYVARVGPNDLPRPLQVRLSVSGPSSLSESSVLGLQAEDFEVFVGSNLSEPNRAEVLGGSYVLGEYWLTVQPPEKPDQSTYDLHVVLASSYIDTQTDAVSYEEQVFDQVLVIDRSGSMALPEDAPKIIATKNAAGLFANLALGSDQIGVVSFNDDATVNAQLALATEGQLNDVIEQIDLISENGTTSIGDGLDLAANELATQGSVLGEDWIVLLSDGQENESQFWVNVESTIKNAGIRVSAIALGEDSDQVLMQEIAQETGGEYYYVDVGSDQTTNGAQESGGGGRLANRLANVYIAANERLRNHQRIFETSDELSNGSSVQHTVKVLGDGIVDARFIVQWEKASDEIEVVVERPDGSIVEEGDSDALIRKSDTHFIVYLRELTAGEWILRLEAAEGDPAYLAVVSGEDRQGAKLSLTTSQVPDPFVNILSGAKFLRGLPQKLSASLFDDAGVIKGRDVEIVATVRHPLGFVNSVPLLDDGLHNDELPNDGVYGNDYTRTTAFSLNDLEDVPGTGSPGSYNVEVVATGTDNAGESFARYKTLSFQIFETDELTSIPPSDTDGDTMPDRYEDLHECLDKNVPDGFGDFDGDTIGNRASYLTGLDPCHPDTDRGGESDVSEITRGGFRFDPADDLVPRLIDAEVINWRYEHLPFPLPGDVQSGANLIRHQFHSSYETIRLLRSLSESGPFLEVVEFLAADFGGLYLDTGLVNGVMYYYKVQPLDVNGNEGAPSHVFSGTPNADPIPPIGSVRINGGAQSVTQLNATLSLVASSDTVAMTISNDASFDGAVEQPFERSLPWLLEADPDSGVATVFVKYTDSSGNESPSVYHAGVVVDDSADVANLRGRGFLEGQAIHSTIFVQPEGPGSVAPDFTGASGSYTLRSVPPGTYDIGFSYPGYQSETVEGVVAVAGQTTFLPDVTLSLLVVDSDGDGVSDDLDNCIDVENPGQTDTNGDGYGNQCDADINNDCVINFLDVVQIQDLFFSDDADADFNVDGTVNFIDYFVMTSSFLASPGPSANVSCP
ncbi:MAG: VWA domain-containing protein [Gammaproteobacteria bacterium]